MKKKYSVISLTVIMALVGIVPTAQSAIRIGNNSRSYADAYNQVNAMRAQASVNDIAAQPTQNSGVENVTSTTSATNTGSEITLPVRVANADLAARIISGDANSPVSYSQLESCSMIYPNGEFAWDGPTVGAGAGGANTCVAVVEMRGYQMGANGSDVVLARANLAAGDTVKCNISEFPEYSYTADAGNIVFPSDSEPTMDDVIQVMNQEQKDNAGLKIAAGALIGALGGNMAGENDIGNSSLLGADKGKLQGTAIGALSGAALMAGNAYAGKVAGDMILSTGVNAAAGSVIGNIAATGESVLRIEDCNIDDRQSRCLWGALATNTPLDPNKDIAYFDITDGETTYVCDANNENCRAEELVAIVLAAYPDMSLDAAIEDAKLEAVLSNSANQFHLERTENSGYAMLPGASSGHVYTKIASAGRIDREIPAMLEITNEKAFGMDQSDWREWKRVYGASATFYMRNANGDATPLPDGTVYTINEFYPMLETADSGSVIDFGNKARLKGTLIGAGAGGAMGAFTAYQGAQDDIQNRWVTAVREYNDSLQKIYCITGDRFLGYYNDDIVIPRMGQY
mgnify:CR=1 FL=1